MDLLAKALQIAIEAHAGQTDRYGKPYIEHPLRVMANCKSQEEKIVAVLHDVVEDSDWTIDRLRSEGFPDTVLTAIACLTKSEGADYDEYVKKAAADPIARKVKIADLTDNLNLLRVTIPLDARDLDRLNKYLRALWFLTGTT